MGLVQGTWIKGGASGRVEVEGIRRVIVGLNLLAWPMIEAEGEPLRVPPLLSAQVKSKVLPVTPEGRIVFGKAPGFNTGVDAGL